MPDNSQLSDLKDDLDNLQTRMAELTRQGTQTEALLTDHTDSIDTAEAKIRGLSEDMEEGKRKWTQLVSDAYALVPLDD